MGCCGSITEGNLGSDQLKFGKILRLEGGRENFKLISEFDLSEVNKIIVQSGSIKTNALGLSIILSDTNLFTYLYSKLNCSFKIFEEHLQNQDIEPIKLFIDHFNPNIFKHYIPFYLERNYPEENLPRNNPPKQGKNTDSKIRGKVHPMRYATENEKIDFIKFVLDYFKGKIEVPDCFDVHSIDKESGENCALIACRLGSLKMVDFLYGSKCNFGFSNLNGENAINLALTSKLPGKGRISVLPFLVEIVGLDITKNYEETLLLSRNSGLTEYIEEELKKKGIFVSKLIVETRFRVNIISTSGAFEKTRSDFITSCNLTPLSPIHRIDSNISLMSPLVDL